jgi:hypothetical protein
VVACSAGGSLAYNQLVANPEQFLLRHRVMVRGSTAGRVRFSTGPTGDYQNVMAFNFQYNAGSDVFEFLEAPLGLLGSAHPVQVISVPAVHWSDVPGVGVAPGNFAGVLGCELAGGPTLMVTTQFTGCSFCWTTHGGVLRASHVSPSGDVAKPNYPGGGQALALRLVNQPGLMSNAGNTALTVFGNHAGNAVTPGGGNAFYPPKVQGAGAGQMKWVSIFGFGGGGWRFYTQAVDGAGTIMAGEARRIM